MPVEITLQLLVSTEVHRSHWYWSPVAAAPLQFPLVACNTDPGVATPVITGNTLACGGVTIGPTKLVKTVEPPVESRAVIDALTYLDRSEIVNE